MKDFLLLWKFFQLPKCNRANLKESFFVSLKLKNGFPGYTGTIVSIQTATGNTKKKKYHFGLMPKGIKNDNTNL